MSELPQELINYIISFLGDSPRDLAIAARVSSGFLYQSIDRVLFLTQTRFASAGMKQHWIDSYGKRSHTSISKRSFGTFLILLSSRPKTIYPPPETNGIGSPFFSFSSFLFFLS